MLSVQIIKTLTGYSGDFFQFRVNCKAAWKQKAMLYSNSNKSPEKQRKDAAEIGASQFEPALVSNDRENRGGTGERMEQKGNYIQPEPVSRFTVKAIS